MTVDEFLAKVEERRTRSKDGYELLRTSSTLDDACWFVAVKQAEDVLDAWSTKDFASLIVEGGTLGGPYKTREDLAVWIQETEEQSGEEGVSAWGWLDAALDRHFGVS